MADRATDDTAPLRTVGAGELAPFVLICEHASRRLPRICRPDATERRILRSHWGFDPGAWAVTLELRRRLGASAVGGRWSRLWIDLNRAPADPTLVRTEVEGHALSWNRRLSPAEIERRLASCHAPFHREIDRLLTRRVVRGGRPLVLALHSFSPKLGRSVRNFDLGILYDHHAGAARRLGLRLRAAGYSVRYNQPYSGRAGLMYAAERHGSHLDLPCLELEINQALTRRPGFAERLGRTLAEALDTT